MSPSVTASPAGAADELVGFKKLIQVTGEDAKNAIVGQVTRQQIMEGLLIAAGGFDVQHQRGIMRQQRCSSSSSRTPDSNPQPVRFWLRLKPWVNR
jgi:hypothetical protein